MMRPAPLHARPRASWKARATVLAALGGALGGLLGATGCGDDWAPLAYRPVPGCEAVDHAPCDILQPTCQRRLFALAACLRGDDETEPPPSTVVSEADFAAMLTAELAAATPNPHADRWDWALSTLELVAPGSTTPEATVAQRAMIWGQYRSDTKDILIVDHGNNLDEPTASRILLHEYVHALQDREIDIAAFDEAFATSSDSLQAESSMIEGEARMHEAHYLASLLGLDPAKVDWMSRFASSIEIDRAWLLMDMSPLTVSWQAFPYEWGARYVYYSWQAGGMTGVHAHLTAPAVTTRILMASVDQALAPEPAPSATPAAPPPDGWMAPQGTVLGAWGLFLTLAGAGAADPDTANGLALHWRGDGLWIYDAESPAAAGAFVWRIDLDDDTTAGMVTALLRSNRSIGEARQLGTRVVIAKSSDGSAIEWAYAP